MPVVSFGEFCRLEKTLSEEQRRKTMSRGLSNGAMDGRVEYRFCRTRETMARQVRKANEKPVNSTTWRPLVKLEDWEGFR